MFGNIVSSVERRALKSLVRQGTESAKIYATFNMFAIVNTCKLRRNSWERNQ